VPQNAVLNYTHIFSPTLVNEAKFGLNASKTRVSGLAPVGSGVNLDGVSIRSQRDVVIGWQLGIRFADGPSQDFDRLQRQIRAVYKTTRCRSFDSVNWIHGNHSFKAGVEVRPLRIENAILGGITYTFPSIQGFLADTPSQIAINGNTNDVSPWTGKGGYFHMRQTFYIGYAQDEWKIRPNVTLSYGLRYEYYSPLHEDNNKVLWFDVPTGTLIPNYTGDWYTMKTDNLGPRVGLSWSPRDGR